jgi:hypothetical protein
LSRRLLFTGTALRYHEKMSEIYIAKIKRSSSQPLCLCINNSGIFELFSLPLELQHSGLMSWRATLILVQRGIVSMVAWMALCCVACRKCRHNCIEEALRCPCLFFSYCYLHMIENTSFPSCNQSCACYFLHFVEFID